MLAMRKSFSLYTSNAAVMYEFKAVI